MNKGKVLLKSYKNEKDVVEYKYSVEQNNGSTSVEQDLVITGKKELFEQKWSAELSLSDFPEQNTPENAALKMAEWLERLAKAIRNGKYIDIEEAEFTDLK